jgi:hypothetical protein
VTAFGETAPKSARGDQRSELIDFARCETLPLGARWDEVLIEMRRFAVEQAVIMKAPSDTLADVFEKADRLVEYISGTG